MALNRNDVFLYRGECLEVLRGFPDGTLDAVIADPPYGTTSNKWDAVIPFAPLWAELLRVTKPTAAICLFSSQPFTSALVMSNPKLWKHEWVWIKNRGSNFANTVREPMKEHETIQVFSRGRWTYNKQMQERTGSGGDRVKYDFNFRTDTENYGEFAGQEGQTLPTLRVPSSWQKYNTEVGLHPTQKPVGLCAYLVRTYTNPGDVVLDFCMGSGSTGAACRREGRRFVGIERDPKYFTVAEQRLGSTASEEAAD